MNNNNITTISSAIIIIFLIAASVLGVGVAVRAPVPAYAQSSDYVNVGGSYSAMNNQTARFIKDYLISVIENNITSTASVIISSDTGAMMIQEPGAKLTDSSDNIFIDLSSSPFKESNGYKFDGGKLVAPNGTTMLPR